MVDGLPADVVNFSLDPDMEKLVKAGLVSTNWDDRADQGHGHRLDRVVRRAQGQPQAHHDLGDLVKSGVQVITPNPFSSGSANWNLMAAYGAQLAQGKSKAAGHSLPGPAAQEHRGPAEQCQQRPADLPLGPRGRAARLRGRRPLRPEPGGGGHSRHPAADHPDPEPDRRHRPRRRTRRRPRRSSPTCSRPPARRSGASRATGRCCRAWPASSTSPSRRPSSPSQSLGGWTKVNTVFFDPADRRGGQDRSRARGLHRQWLTSGSPAPHCVSKRRARRPGASVDLWARSPDPPSRSPT